MAINPPAQTHIHLQVHSGARTHILTKTLTFFLSPLLCADRKLPPLCVLSAKKKVIGVTVCGDLFWASFVRVFIFC